MIGLCDLSGATVYPIKGFSISQMHLFCNKFNSYKNNSCKILSFKNLKESLDYIDIFPNPDNYSKILIFSSCPNFWGGVENTIILEIFKFLARFNGDIYYLFNDFTLPFMEIYKNVLTRKWNKWTEDELKLKQPVNIITSFKDTELVKEMNLKKFENIKSVNHIDFNTWELEKEYEYLENQNKYDIVYGVNNRKNRYKRIDKYLGDLPNDISLYMYGNCKPELLKNSYNTLTKEPRVSPDKVLYNNSLGFSTIIIGEKFYDNNQIPERLYQSILANCICFIDNEFDKDHTIFKNDYFYVNSKDELVDKIKNIKSDKLKYNKLIKEQHNFLESKAKEKNIKKVFNLVYDS